MFDLQAKDLQIKAVLFGIPGVEIVNDMARLITAKSCCEVTIKKIARDLRNLGLHCETFAFADDCFVKVIM